MAFPTGPPMSELGLGCPASKYVALARLGIVRITALISGQQQRSLVLSG